MERRKNAYSDRIGILFFDKIRFKKFFLKMKSCNMKDSE